MRDARSLLRNVLNRPNVSGWVRVTPRAVGAALVSLVSLSGVPLLGHVPEAKAAIVERIVAVIDQDAVLLSDLKERALPYLLRVYSSVPEGPQRAANISQIYKVVLEQMIDERLEEDAAREAGVEISEEQVDAAIAQTAAQNQMSVNQILVEAKRSGLSIENYRDELRRQLIQRTMMELRLRGRVNITESDIRTAYRRLVFDERMQLPQRTAQLRVPAGSTPQERASGRALAQSLADAARSGADFRQLIAENTVDSASGLRPELPPMQEPPQIQRATLSLDVGEVSPPLLIDEHWVVLKVMERPPSELPPYVEARAQVHERVYMEKLGKAREHWLKGLRRRTHVELRL